MVPKPGSTLVLSTGIDYLTATQRPGPSTDLLKVLADRWIMARSSEGYQVKPWHWMGYDGECTDGISCGSRPDGWIIRLSGRVATTHGYQVLRLSRQVSRIDLQVTILDIGPWFNWAGECIRKALEDERVKSGITRTTIIYGTPEGSTAYVGSRSSERYFRVYDKHAESKGAYPLGSWRWEVEWKGDRAQRVAERVKGQSATPQACLEYVTGAFGDYGIVLPCESLPSGWRDSCIHEETNDEKRLAWLEASIAPVVQRMIASLGPDTVMEALGLPYGDYEPRKEQADDGGYIAIVP